MEAAIFALFAVAVGLSGWLAWRSGSMRWST